MTAAPIWRSQKRLDLIRVEAEDKIAINGLLWEPETASDSLVLMVPGGTTGAALFPAHDYDPLAGALTMSGYAFLVSNMRAAYNYPCAEYADASERHCRVRGLRENEGLYADRHYGHTTWLSGTTLR